MFHYISICFIDLTFQYFQYLEKNKYLSTQVYYPQKFNCQTSSSNDMLKGYAICFFGISNSAVLGKFVVWRCKG